MQDFLLVERFVLQQRLGQRTQVELVISAALVGATIGAIASGRLTDHVGRRAVLLGAAVSFAVGAIASALASGATMLIVARFLVGAAIGVASYAVPLYISELAPPRWRGWLVSLNQLALTVGRSKRSRAAGVPFHCRPMSIQAASQRD